MSTGVRRFFAANRRLSAAVEARLPDLFKRHPHTLYKYEVAELLNRRLGQVVLDVGGGKDCPFFPYINQPRGQLIIGLDYSEDQLRGNRDINQKIVADATARGLPLRDGSADLVVSRSVVEHLRDNKAFFENCTNVLRPGGAMISCIPRSVCAFCVTEPAAAELASPSHSGLPAANRMGGGRKLRLPSLLRSLLLLGGARSSQAKRFDKRKI